MGLFEKTPTTGDACLQKGKEAQWKGSYPAAIDYYRKGAEQFNNKDCQCALGNLYLSGLVTYEGQKDSKMHFELAVFWLRKAVEGGLVDYNLFLSLGVIYLIGGEGVSADEKEAMSWINKATALYAVGYKVIGMCYFRGDFTALLPSSNVKIDYKKALEYLLQAAENYTEDYSSLEKIVTIYFKGGHGVEKNYEKALFYGEKIPLRFRGEAAELMMDLYLEAGLLHQFCKYPPDYKLALDNYLKFRDGYRGDAMLRIGMLYLRGLGVKKNLSTACSFICQSTSPYWKGFVKSSGFSGIEIDYEAVFKVYLATSENDEYFGQALNAIGRLYQQGLGVEQSHTKANSKFIQAAEIGCSEAYNSLGDVYKYGYGEDVDYDKAFEWHSKAAKEPYDNDGQFKLGMMYIEGKGTEFDPERALYWFERAQVFGNEKAHPSFITMVKAFWSRTNVAPSPRNREPLQFFHLP
ncbi:unnamed protein product [Mucor hiemalis]